MARPVMLIHGWGGSGATFRPAWRQAFAQAGRAVATCDLPGHGDPAASIDPMDYADMASALDERFGAGPLDIVAYSLGAKLALELALRQPERFGRMVLGGIGDNIFAPERAGQAIAAALEHGVDADTPAHAAAMARYAVAGGSSAHALAAVLRRPHNPCHDPARLAALTVPSLVVNGDADTVAVPDQYLLTASASIRGIRIPGVDHVALPDSPGFLRHAVDFLCGPERSA